MKGEFIITITDDKGNQRVITKENTLTVRAKWPGFGLYEAIPQGFKDEIYLSTSYSSLLRFSNPITQQAYQNFYYYGAFPSGGTSINISISRTFVPPIKESGYEVSWTTTQFLGPITITAIGFYLYIYKDFYATTIPMSLAVFDTPIQIASDETYVIQYKITMRW